MWVSHIISAPSPTKNRKHWTFYISPSSSVSKYIASEFVFSCSPYNAKNPFLAPIIVIRELHKGGDRSCMHVELDISGSRLNYVAGDHLAIFPANDPQLVERIGELLEIDLGTVFTLTNTDGKGCLSLTHSSQCCLFTCLWDAEQHLI